ncbi:MAG: patatin family protein [Clostridia bacterium]|nr:patatin family protein [Clostridia bacterium]
MKKGLILEGGAMRGLFTAGVLDVMMENGIVYDGAIGVSAGAAFGCNYKSGQIGRVIRYNTKFIRDKRYCGFRVLLRTGNFYSTEFCYKEVPLKYDIFDFDAYRKNPMDFYVVCTDIEAGKAVYHKFEGDKETGFDWIRASASMPIVSQIVEIDGKKLLDGGITDSVPLKYFQSIGYDKNVVILTQPKGYVKKKNRFIPLIKHIYKNYPNMVEAIKNRHNVYNDTLDYISEQEKMGTAFVIQPKEDLPVKRTERSPEKLRETYEIGRQIALELLPDILEYLNR